MVLKGDDCGIVTKETILSLTDPTIFQSPPPRTFTSFDYFKSPSLNSNSSLTSSSTPSEPLTTPKTILPGSFLAPSKLYKPVEIKERVPLSIKGNQIKVAGIRASEDFEKLVSASPVPMFMNNSFVFNEENSYSSEHPLTKKPTITYPMKLDKICQDFIKRKEVNTTTKVNKLSTKRVLGEKNGNQSIQNSTTQLLTKKPLFNQSPTSSKVKELTDALFSLEKPSTSLPKTLRKLKEVSHNPVNKSSASKSLEIPAMDSPKVTTISPPGNSSSRSRVAPPKASSPSIPDCFESDPPPSPPTESTYNAHQLTPEVNPIDPDSSDSVPRSPVKRVRRNVPVSSTPIIINSQVTTQDETLKVTRSGRVVSKPRQYWKNEPIVPSTIQISFEWGASQVKITKSSTTPPPKTSVVDTPDTTSKFSSYTNSRSSTSKLVKPKKVTRAKASKKVTTPKKSTKPNLKPKSTPKTLGGEDKRENQKRKTRKTPDVSNLTIPTLGIASPGILKPFTRNPRADYTTSLKKSLKTAQSHATSKPPSTKPSSRRPTTHSRALRQALAGDASHLFTTTSGGYHDDDSDLSSPYLPPPPLAANTYYDLSE